MISKKETVTNLANKVFGAFPKEVSSLKLYIMDCGCIYYQRIFSEAILDSRVGIYNEAENKPCENCLPLQDNWKERSVAETVFHNPQFQTRSVKAAVSS
jgi:hypothetical protein